MRSVIRPSIPEDAPAITALIAERGLRPDTSLQALHWKYWLPRADFLGPRSFVSLRGDRLIAHAALIPGAFRGANGRQSTAHVIDWVARSGDWGAGATLMKHVGQQAESLLAIGGSDDTLRILPHLGFRRAGGVRGYVRPLYPLQILRSQPLSSRLPARFLRSLIWKHSVRGAQAPEWQTYPVISGEDLARLSGIFAVVPAEVTLLERSIELLAYVLACPCVPMRLFIVGNSQHTKGYFLLAFAQAQVRLVDWWIDSNAQSDLCALVGCAVRQAMLDQQAAEIVVWGGDPEFEHALINCGFHARHNMIVQIRPTEDETLPRAPLRLNMLDNDAAYLHEEKIQLWA
jgi:hypothetical protein